MEHLLLEMQPKAQQALASSPVAVLRTLRVDQAPQGLVITGRVASFYHKQLAQEAVRCVCEGVPIVNRVDVDAQRVDVG
jgi:hypothetical protein